MCMPTFVTHVTAVLPIKKMSPLSDRGTAHEIGLRRHLLVLIMTTLPLNLHVRLKQA